MTGLALILVLGVGAQWVAWRLRLPSILILLLFGFLAGPILHVVDPVKVLGESLVMPVVSLSVALILFEGGMSLKFSELRHVGAVVRNLVSVGALTTGLVTAAAGHWIVGLQWQVAALLGAILSVTGPTVIGPLLRHVRPVGRIGPILKWEGIIIDPLGAMAAVLVFELIQGGGFHHVQRQSPALIGAVVKTLGVGCLIGSAFAGGLLLLFRRRQIPDHLQSPMTLMSVGAAFVLSNALQDESGLLTVTVMGLLIANQRFVLVEHIADFKETLTILLISSLFIILAARVDPRTILALGWRGPALLAALILVARPACVAVSTIGSGLSWRQRLFLAAMAPRGIVAAAVSSVFALRLHGIVPGGELLVPLTFTVIIGTVLVYGLTAAPLGWWLGVAWPNAQGCLIVGAHPLGRAIGTALQAEGFPVLLADTNRANIQSARLEGLPTYLGSVVSQGVQDRVELSGIGRLLALTSNDEVNSLASLAFSRAFGRSEVYQLAHPTGAPEERAAGARAGATFSLLRRRKKQDVARNLGGRMLFGQAHSYTELATRVAAGAVIKKTRLTETFGLREFQQLYGTRAAPMFLIEPTRELKILTDEAAVAARAGQTLVSLVEPNAPSPSQSAEMPTAEPAPDRLAPT